LLICCNAKCDILSARRGRSRRRERSNSVCHAPYLIPVVLGCAQRPIAPLACAPRRTMARLRPIHPSRLVERHQGAVQLALARRGRPQFNATAALSSAARKPLASFKASSLAQK
jgi:hypothetical protein